MIKSLAHTFIKNYKLNESFYIVSTTMLKEKIDLWREKLPRVTPFYAVKCNPNKEMIKLMIKENMGFDCASHNEIDTVLKLGANKNNIIFAHPVKKTEDLDYAINTGIKYTTFDSISELEKLQTHAPSMKCLIRLKVDNPTARVQLGLKYGAAKSEYTDLIDAAYDMNINIVGTSFHVGSASKDPIVFMHGLNYSRDVFDYAKKKGYIMDILDIGGGFTKDTFTDCSNIINYGLDKHFNDPEIKIISEPGRFFAEEIFTFFTPIIGQKIKDDIFNYWITDGMYGSFNCIIYDSQIPKYEVLRNPLLPTYTGDNENLQCVIQGVSCDVADRVGTTSLPYIRNKDFLMVQNFGAYTISAAKDFNGINMTNIIMFYV